MPVTTATFGAPFELAAALRAPSPDDRADEPDDRADERDDRADEPDDRADELRLRDAAVFEPRLEALALFGLLRAAEDLVLLLEERVFAWAIAPP
jgi:hypothetical protein